MQEQILSLGCFLEFQEAMQKKQPNDNLKKFAYIFALASVLV